MSSIITPTLHRKPRVSLVTVYVETRRFPEGTRYCVARHAGGNTIFDEPDYSTEFAAYVAAASTAVRLGAKLMAPDAMRSRLVAYWYRRGRRMFYADQPRALCANKYERAAYDLAEAEVLAHVSEADSKPGLTDCVEMAVARPQAITIYPGEYGFSEVAA
ncbi:MAG: hypothetical protein IT328_20000 [Caldilineaceae bacterium]|nr:hypothetical protein [Caldilineaceae bacterium]